MINRDELPIILKIRILHKDIYQIGEKLNKRDKLGIHKEIENLSIQCLSLAINTAFRPVQTKNISLEALRIKISVLKNLIRTESELNIINKKTYLRLAEQAVEISNAKRALALFRKLSREDQKCHSDCQHCSD